MRAYKKNQIFQSVLSLFLILAVISALFAVLNVLRNSEQDDLKTIYPKFSVGSIDDNGKFLDVKNSICTKDVFACKGLKVVPDFGAKLTYKVYFYDVDYKYISCSAEFGNAQDVVLPADAVNARLVVKPITDDDTELNFFDCVKLAGKITVKVSDDQSFEEPEKIVDDEKNEVTAEFEVTALPEGWT